MNFCIIFLGIRLNWMNICTFQWQFNVSFTYLTQLTESWCAFFTALVWRFVIGSNKTIDLFSHAAINSVLQERNLQIISCWKWIIAWDIININQNVWNLLKITHLVNILSYKRHHIRNLSHFQNYYSNSYMAPNVCISICEFCLRSQHCV